MLYNRVNDVKLVIEDDSGLEITCGIGAPCNKMEDLFSSYSQSKTALSYQVSLGLNKIYDINDMSKIESSFYYPETLITKLVHSIMFDSVDIIKETLTTINDDILKKHSLSLENIQIINVEIITHIFKELYKVEDIDPSIWQDGLSLYGDIQKAKSNQKYIELIANFAIKSSLQFSNKRINSKSRIVENTKDIVTSRYSDSQLSLSEIAYELNISTGYLSTVFKSKTGETLSKYISKTRIEAAMLLLKTTSKMTYKIAEDTGFDNAHYFSYAFKKLSGISPTDYRDSRKGKVVNV